VDDEEGSDAAKTHENDERERLLSAIDARRVCLEENKALRGKLEARVNQLRLERPLKRIVGDNAALRAEIHYLQGEKATAKREHEERKSELEVLISEMSEECEALRRELE